MSGPYDWSRVSRETALEIVEAFATSQPWPEDALRRARAEASPPLRTRAEVDAEIAQFFRDRERQRRALGLPRVHGGIHFSDTEASKLLELCAEPLAPEPDPECSNGGDCIESITSPGFCAKCEKEMPCRAPSPEGIACHFARGHTREHHWQEDPDPDPCSCEESLGLRARIDRALALYDACGVQCDSMRLMADALRG